MKFDEPNTLNGQANKQDSIELSATIKNLFLPLNSAPN
jgi:hypothetical protein